MAQNYKIIDPSITQIKTGTPAIKVGSRFVVAGIGGNYIPGASGGTGGSGGPDVYLGVAVSGGTTTMFQQLAFSGTSAYDYGQPSSVSGNLRTYNTGHPVPSSGGGIITSDGNITQSAVLSGYIGYNSSGRIVGTIQSLAGSTHSMIVSAPSSYTVPGGIYLAGSQTVDIQLTGNITSSAVLAGYSGLNSSGVVSGTIPSLASSSYTVGTQGLTLSSGYYLAGNQTFIGSGGGGIVTSDGNITSDKVLSGYIGYNSSGKVIGSIPSLPANSYTIGFSGIGFPSGYYLAGDQEITIQPGYYPTSDATITSNTILSGYSGYGSSGRISGTIPSLASSSYTVGAQGITLSSGYYLAGNQTFTASAGEPVIGTVWLNSNTASMEVYGAHLALNKATISSSIILRSSGGAPAGTATLQQSSVLSGNLTLSAPAAVAYITQSSIANQVTLKTGTCNISSGGTISSCTISGGSCYVGAGGVIQDATIKGGITYVKGSGIGSDFAGIRAPVISGGTLTADTYGVIGFAFSYGTVVTSSFVSIYGGSVYVKSGATAFMTKATASMAVIQSGAVVISGYATSMSTG